jgi:hypothetical protein
MSLLGEYKKQPVEVEVYSIQFVEDMASTDEIDFAYQVLARDSAAAWDQEVKTVPYTASLSDAERILVSTADITLPVDAPEGYRLSVSNQNQNTAIFVNTISLPARGSSVVVRKSGAWVEEAKTNATLVNGVGDQRVRVRVFGGTPWEIYKIQVTVTTSEGRTMQDEFIVEIEEV